MNAVEQILDKALQNTPEDWSVRLELLTRLQERGEHQELARILEAAPSAPGEESEMKAVLEMLDSTDQKDVRARLLGDFSAAHPASAWGHYELARSLVEGGDLDRARQHYKAATSLHADYSNPELEALLAPPVEEEVVEESEAEEAIHEEVAEGEMEYDESGEPVEGGRHLILSEDTSMVKAAESRNTSLKITAIAAAVIVHMVIGIALWQAIVNMPVQAPPQITATAIPVLDDPTTETNTVEKQQIQQKPVQAASAQMEVMAVSGASAVAMPDIQTDMTTFDPIGLGDAFGASMTFSASEEGGMVSFFGSKSTSKKVVFAVDYSASMRSQDKDKLMRKELVKSLEALPGGIEYQCIFFHGPAWYHGQEVKINNPDKKDEHIHYMVLPERGRDEWKWYSGFAESDRIKKGGRLQYVFHPATGSEKPEDLPKGEYLKSTRSNLRKSIKIVEDTRLGAGTDWRWPLYMAINMEPDTIYFMTDGAFSTKGKVLEDIIDHNRKKGRSKINAICLMVPQAMDELGFLSEKSRGELSLVLRDQTVLRGKELEDFLKKR